MLGSLSVYRRVLNDNIFNPRRIGAIEQGRLPVVGHAMAGMMAGWTVSFIAGPVEHIKARLQVQYAAEKSKRLYSGPIDCLKKTVKSPSILLQALSHGLIVPQPRCARRLPRSLCNTPLPDLLLFLVGYLRHLHASLQETHQPLYTSHQFLGRWPFRTDLLDHVLSIRRCQTARHDRSAWTRTQVPALARRCKSSVEGKRMERVLARICALLFKSLSSECDGARGIRSRNESAT